MLIGTDLPGGLRGLGAGWRSPPGGAERGDDVQAWYSSDLKEMPFTLAGALASLRMSAQRLLVDRDDQFVDVRRR